MTVEQLASAFMNIRGEMLVAAGKAMSATLKRKLSAEDVVQETYLSAAQRRGEFSTATPFKDKFQAMMDETIVKFTKQYCPEALQEKPEGAPVDIDMDGMKDESRIRVAQDDPYASLHKALEGMSDEDREILDLRHFKGLTNTACAKMLHISPKTAANRYAQALLHLKERLSPAAGFKL